MLQLLHIENIAVIERADIELDKGLTVLSGETGAGKSIVIDSIGALLGKRVSRDLVRSGAQKGFVSAVFTDLPRALRELLDELALSGDEPDTLYVQRQISADGKSTCRVNMKPASAAVLRQLAPYLIDIHVRMTVRSCSMKHITSNIWTATQAVPKYSSDTARNIRRW